MKWILGLVAVLGVAAFVYQQRHSVKTSYVNGLPEYNELPGKEYIFQRDCYIFKFKEANTTWPLVGAHVTVPALPVEITGGKVGAELPEVRILDLVRVGDRFKIVSVRREESRQGTEITFEILFVDEAERKYPRLDAKWILDQRPAATGGAPTILPEYAVERVKK